jgi:hypothetical protein
MVCFKWCTTEETEGSEVTFGAFERQQDAIPQISKGKKRGILQPKHGERRKKGRIQFGPVEEHEFDESSTPAGVNPLPNVFRRFIRFCYCLMTHF